MHEPRVSWLPPSAAAAQVWAVEALIDQRRQRRRQSVLRRIVAPLLPTTTSAGLRKPGRDEA
ncbi:MAG TPA: hypothetical protein VFZ85_15615 [Jiangellaceae bacterium]